MFIRNFINMSISSFVLAVFSSCKGSGNSPHGQFWSLLIVLLSFCDPFFKVGGYRNTNILTWLWNTFFSSLTSSFNLSTGAEQGLR